MLPDVLTHELVQAVGDSVGFPSVNKDQPSILMLLHLAHGPHCGVVRLRALAQAPSSLASLNTSQTHLVAGWPRRETGSSISCVSCTTADNRPCVSNTSDVISFLRGRASLHSHTAVCNAQARSSVLSPPARSISLASCVKSRKRARCSPQLVAVRDVLHLPREQRLSVRRESDALRTSPSRAS